MIIDSIATYLADNGIGTVGSSIFIGELPYDYSDIISLITTPSPLPNAAIAYYTQVIDIWGRFASYESGMNKLQSILELLHRKENYEISGFHIYVSFSMGMIDDMDRDMERRHLSKLSLAFVYRKIEPAS